MKKLFEEFILCNFCGGKLNFKSTKLNSSLFCKKCSKEIKEIDGVYIFENYNFNNSNKIIYDSFWKDIKNADIKCKSYLFEKKLFNENYCLFKDKIILDAGVGDGRHLEIIARQNPKGIICVDLSESVFLAKRRWDKSKLTTPIIFIKSRIENLNFKKESIDTIWCAGVITVAENYKSIISYFSKNANKNIILGLLSKNLFGKIYFALNPYRPFFRKLKKYRFLYFFLIPLCCLILIVNLIFKIKEF